MKNNTLTVAKFGGTSLANPENIRRVIDIIKSNPARQIIVVSAPGKRSKDDIKITDKLIDIFDKKEAGECFDEVFDLVANRYYEIEREFNLDCQLGETFDEFYSEIPEGNRDFIISSGEYFMAKLMAGILDFEFVDLDKSNVISFDKDGNVNLEQGRKSFVRFKGKNVVVPGFYGITHSGTIKTFPRGGSDITGAVIANIAGADLYENWTDVDGVYDSDPNKNQDAKRYDTLTYDQALTITTSGAQVLHPEVFRYVQDAGIPIHLKNTFNPNGDGTIIKA